MLLKRAILFVSCLLMSGGVLFANKVREVDICVYGGTSAGVIAAYTAKQLHKTVLLISPDQRLGGLTTGGLGYTDIGNKFAITGISRDFYRRIGHHYGKLEQWIFEPHVAEATFQQYIKEAGVEVLYNYSLASVVKNNGGISTITVEGATPLVVKAKMFIDCSYEGDLMAKAGVKYTVGREANSLYSETYNGVQLRDKHQFPDGIDPYKEPGNPQSGLLWGISDAAPDENGTGDKKVQAYNFRICLTSNPDNRIPITRPENYDPSQYELLVRLLQHDKSLTIRNILKFDYMPGNKTDINNNGPFSTDMIGMNYNYPEASKEERRKIIKAHEDYTKGLLYFIGHDSRIPQAIRDEMLKWGYPKDEYTDNGNWSPQLYIREARRMVGAYVMTQANCQGRETVNDGVGMAAYTMDSHNCQRIVVNGMVKNEGDVQIGGFGPYPVSYRSLIPREEDCSNLLVPVCLSASHIAYGSIRMEPVFMVLAQSAATAAVEAINSRKSVQQVDVSKVQQQLKNNPLANGSTPEILVDNDDSTQVKLTGNWVRETKSGGYGHSLYADYSKGSEAKEISFQPAIKQSGKYHVYTYIPKIQHLSGTTTINIRSGDGNKEIKVSASDIKIEGQTSGEWVDLGSYHFKAGSNGAVVISNKQADGAVVADAVLFIAEK
ncbi:FAD dependent oxidoreductase [Chitinophaga terrae (ex Kim and Jung 2007)]|uniref:FAD dependent oxidoreductase n=1 Tax=Chitinophaga terrae (ex Kim and Jung 2007) TaxID=408074 RepID=A0A1H4EGW0_9BACT|nr:FAD-dependent oxidoreductase [Chitinophaga terrae (ex Kim and Jung 2007)]SEA84233.1 FAD dependent oxidoreductase [Chitinophaga terrae (ex Kim and Jung 2007)]